MIQRIEIDPASITPIFKQIKKSIIAGIKDGQIKVGEKLPSINEVCRKFTLSPGTVTKAYEELRQQGIVSSKQGKGYYINSLDTKTKKRILLLFDRLNAYKEILYYSFIDKLEANTETDVYFHHYDKNRFEKVIHENLGQYTHYIVMPHLKENITPTLQKIPVHQLYLLDKKLNDLTGKFGTVYQDFEHDVITCLEKQVQTLRKYKKLCLIKSKSRFQFIPNEIITGLKTFGDKNSLLTQTMQGYQPDKLKKHHCYLIFADNELISALKTIDNKKWTLGKEIGIISYDDTPMKELLYGGISVITTDFQKMGQSMAEMINENTREKIANPCKFMDRGSV